MRLVTALFAASSRADYRRLAGALVSSVATHSPATPLTVIEAIADTRLYSRHAGASDKARESFVFNTRKMQLWQEAVAATPDGEIVGLLDADTLVLRDLSDLAAGPADWHVTYTQRPPGSRFPINSGVVFARGGAEAREFFARWRAVNEAMLLDPAMHQRHRAEWGGINQAALGAMIMDPAGPARLLEQQCAEWNCEDTTWHLYDPAVTRILHIKGRLRKCCLADRAPDPVTAPLLALWRAHDSLPLPA